MSIKALGYLALTVVLVAATAGYFNGLGKDKIAAGLGYYSGCQKDKAKQQAVQVADEKHVVAAQQATQGAEHDAKADAIAPELAALRAEVARLRRVSAPALAVDAPANELAPLVEAQDRVIQSQDAHDAEVTAARDSWRSDATASQEESKQLRVALDNAPRRTTHQVLAAYNWVTKDAMVGYTHRVGSIGPVTFRAGGMVVYQDQKPGAYALVTGEW